MDYDNYIDDIIDIIEQNENLIEYDYNSKKDQILLLKELVKKIYVYINGVKEINPKNLLNLTIRDAFELSKHDLIISKNGYILLKLIDESKIKEVANKDKNTIANRYSGIDEEELKSFYDEFIVDSAHENFFLVIAKEFADIYFHEKKINNVIYEKNVFGYIQAIIFEHLVAMYNNDDGFFNGFAGYIFRIHFKEVFENIADIVLDELSMSNSYIVGFLEYYSSNIIVMNGLKYKVPHIETKDGLRWTVVSMLSIAKVYTKTTKSIIELKKEIPILYNTIKKLYISNLSPIAYDNAYTKSKYALENKIKHIKKKYEEQVTFLSETKSEIDKKMIKIKIRDIKISMDGLLKEYDSLLKREIDKGIIKKYVELQSELDLKSRNLERYKKVIIQNKQQYISIRESLVKALIAKKKKV